MPSLDYIEKLTELKRKWIQIQERNGISLGFSGSLAARLKNTSALIVRAAGPPRNLVRAIINILHFSIKSCISPVARDAICSCGHTFSNEKKPFCLSMFPNFFSAKMSCSRSCVSQSSFPKKWLDDAMSAPARSFASLMKSIFLVPVTFPACFPSMNLKEMLPVRSTKLSSS